MIFKNCLINCFSANLYSMYQTNTTAFDVKSPPDPSQGLKHNSRSVAFNQNQERTKTIDTYTDAHRAYCSVTRRVCASGVLNSNYYLQGVNQTELSQLSYCFYSTPH